VDGPNARNRTSRRDDIAMRRHRAEGAMGRKQKRTAKRFREGYRRITNYWLDKIIAAGGGLSSSTLSREQIQEALEEEALAGQIYDEVRMCRKSVTLEQPPSQRLLRPAPNSCGNSMYPTTANQMSNQ
jgi:hypothetical protein